MCRDWRVVAAVSDEAALRHHLGQRAAGLLAAVDLVNQAHEIAKMVAEGKLAEDLDCRALTALADLRRMTYLMEHCRAEAMSSANGASPGVN